MDDGTPTHLPVAGNAKVLSMNRLRLWLSAWFIRMSWRVVPRMTPEAAKLLKGTTYHNSSTGELRYWTGEEWLPVTQPAPSPPVTHPTGGSTPPSNPKSLS